MRRKTVFSHRKLLQVLESSDLDDDTMYDDGKYLSEDYYDNTPSYQFCPKHGWVEVETYDPETNLCVLVCGHMVERE